MSGPGAAVRTVALPQEAAPPELSAEEKMLRLEAVLFVAREPLSSRKLSQYAGLADGTEARTLIRRLNAVYDRQGRAFRVEAVAGGHQLLTRPKFGDWVRRAAHIPPFVRLSAPALETLAVIAYRQPVLRAEIEAIRGVNCGEILRQLMDRDLVRIGGRSDELGRPYLYATTRRFLQTFGLGDLDDLPRAELYRRSSETAAVVSADTLQPGRTPHIPGLAPTNPDVPEEKSDVTITTFSETRTPDQVQRFAWRNEWTGLAPASAGAGIVAFDEEEVEDDDAEDVDEEDDYEDDDEEFEDEDFDDEDFDDEEMEDEEFADEEFDDEEWEEVGDDEDEFDDDDDEEEDWDEE